MKICKDEITKSRDVEARDVWKEVQRFLESGEYSSYKKAGSLAKLTLAGHRDSYIARELGIEETTVRIHRRNTSKELFDLYGNDFFDLLSNYGDNKKEINLRLSNIRNLGIRASELIPEEIIASVSSSLIEPIDDIDIRDCVSELKYLSRYSIASMKAGLRAQDLNKINYILDVINSNTGSPSDRQYALSVLMQKEIK